MKQTYKLGQNQNTPALSGIGNKPIHQIIIADVVCGIRGQLQKNELVISEISLDKNLGAFELIKNHNVDVCVFDVNTEIPQLIIEVENMKEIRENTRKKLNDCLKNIKGLKEVLIIQWDENENVKFTLWTIKNNKIKKTHILKDLDVPYGLYNSLVTLKNKKMV